MEMDMHKNPHWRGNVNREFMRIAGIILRKLESYNSYHVDFVDSFITRVMDYAKYDENGGCLVELTKPENNNDFEELKTSSFIPFIIDTVCKPKWNVQNGLYSFIFSSFIKWESHTRSTPDLSFLDIIDETTETNNQLHLQWKKASASFIASNRIGPPIHSLDCMESYFTNVLAMEEAELQFMRELSVKSQISCVLHLYTGFKGTLIGHELAAWYSNFRIVEGVAITVFFDAVTKVDCMVHTVTIESGGRTTIAIRGSFNMQPNTFAVTIQLAVDYKQHESVQKGISWLMDSIQTGDETQAAFFQALLLGKGECLQLSPSTIIIPLFEDSGIELLQQDPDQQSTIAQCASNQLTIVQGPPGTGKTSIIISLCILLFKLGKRVLFVSETNRCADDFLRKLKTRPGLPEALRQSTVRVNAVSHASPLDLESFDLNFKTICTCNRRNSLSDHIHCLQQTLTGSMLVISTLSTSGSDFLAHLPFDFILIDEASKASEPKILLALSRKFESVCLFGDYCQGGPFVHSSQAKQLGMEVSIHERGFQTPSLKPHTKSLTTQFRMAPGLYSGLLTEVYPDVRTTSTMEDWLENNLQAELRLSAMQIFNGINASSIFAHCDSLETTTKKKSKMNYGEALAAFYIMKKLLSKKIPASSIKFISFYEGQVQLFKSLAEIRARDEVRKNIRSVRKKLERENREISTVSPNQAECADLTWDEKEGLMVQLGYSPTQYLQVEAATVDSFQGQEGDIIIVSFVRSNSHNRIGFLRPQERMVIALSRARLLNILIGNAQTLLLSGSPTFRSIISSHYPASFVPCLDLSSPKQPENNSGQKRKEFDKKRTGEGNRKQRKSYQSLKG